eukprot:NODE_596_length_1340_cov_28.233306_g557_i0.p1 GENE.NODE_596_length_1340_cov_28.233306_g557_i0~~NODE_596_length_1340_cov_28.233306_g557_i0.p1  ORF type:complete len:328 (-),score=24.83 NODE_596_length_1340_cov_28.233306_g557_i0:224-1207(-)
MTTENRELSSLEEYNQFIFLLEKITHQPAQFLHTTLFNSRPSSISDNEQKKFLFSVVKMITKVFPNQQFPNVDQVPNANDQVPNANDQVPNANDQEPNTNDRAPNTNDQAKVIQRKRRLKKSENNKENCQIIVEFLQNDSIERVIHLELKLITFSFNHVRTFSNDATLEYIKQNQEYLSTLVYVKNFIQFKDGLLLMHLKNQGTLYNKMPEMFKNRNFSIDLSTIKMKVRFAKFVLKYPPILKLEMAFTKIVNNITSVESRIQRLGISSKIEDVCSSIQFTFSSESEINMNPSQFRSYFLHIPVEDETAQQQVINLDENMNDDHVIE